LTANRPPVRTGEAVTLAMLLGVGAMARLSHAMASGVWRDEAETLDIISLPGTREMIEFLVHHESHPPLHYLLLRGWTSLVGTSDAAVVVPGILVGLVTIAAAWWLARSFASSSAGLLAAALCSLGPSMIQADAMARPYALLQLLLVVAAGCMWAALSSANRLALWLWAITAVALLYTHNWTILPIAGMTVVALWLIARGYSRLSIADVVKACGAIAILWLPWWPSLWYQTQHGGHLPAGPNAWRLLPLQLGIAVPGLRDQLGIVIWGAMGAVTLVRLKDHRAARPGLAAFLVGTVVMAMLLAAAGSFVTNLLIVHTVTMLAPLFLVATAVVLCEPSPSGRILARFSAALLLGLSAVGAGQLALTPRSNAALIAQYLNSATRADDLVLIVPVYVASSIHRYYRGPAPLAGYPDGVVSHPLEFNDRVRRDTAAGILVERAREALRTLETGGRVWVISYEAPDHLKAQWRSLEQELERFGGPPTWIVASRREATMEHLDLREFSGRSRPPDR
jgi:hypothetical protein